MNILLTCAGRRNYLIDYFRCALVGNGLILATDVNNAATALQEADIAYQVPTIDDPSYLSVLIDICRDNNVNVLLSLNDLELPLLAAAREQFLNVGTFPIVSSEQVIDICFDKYLTTQFVSELGIQVPQTYLVLQDALTAIHEERLTFPLVIKPRWGSASIGIMFPEDEDELVWGYHLISRQIQRTILAKISATDAARSIMIQPKVQGNEYGLDIVNDLEGQYRATFVKRKLAMRSGETDRAVTEIRPDLERIGASLGGALGHIGNLDCDIIDGPEGPILLELNPRFGGGYPFSHVAGANIPAAILTWATGEEADPAWLRIRPGVASGKCDRLVPIAMNNRGAINSALPSTPVSQMKCVKGDS